MTEKNETNENSSEQKSGMLKKTGQFIARCFGWIRLGLYWLIGSYRLPPWLRYSLLSPWLLTGGLFRLMRFWKNRHVRSFWLGAPVLGLLLIAVFWMLLSPAPKGISIEVLEPGLTRIEREAIPLQSIVDGDVRRVYWFLDTRYLGESRPNTPFFWKARPGRFLLRVVDDQGRSDAREIHIARME